MCLMVRVVKPAFITIFVRINFVQRKSSDTHFCWFVSVQQQHRKFVVWHRALCDVMRWTDVQSSYMHKLIIVFELKFCACYSEVMCECMKLPVRVYRHSVSDDHCMTYTILTVFSPLNHVKFTFTILIAIAIVQSDGDVEYFCRYEHSNVWRYVHMSTVSGMCGSHLVIRVNKVNSFIY